MSVGTDAGACLRNFAAGNKAERCGEVAVMMSSKELRLEKSRTG